MAELTYISMGRKIYLCAPIRKIVKPVDKQISATICVLKAHFENFCENIRKSSIILSSCPSALSDNWLRFNYTPQQKKREKFFLINWLKIK